MRFAVFFASLSALFMWLAVRLGPASIGGVAGLVTALGLVGATVAYALGRPQLLGKQEDGTRAGWASLVHGSYLGLCRFSSTAARFRGDDPWNSVEPGILLGACPIAREAGTLLDKEGVGAVLDLTCELEVPPRLRKNAAYLCLPVLDGTPPTADQLTAGVDFIEHHRGGGAVYVHCAVGRGRSATMLAAWLLAVGDAESVAAAEAQLQAKRPTVRLHHAQKAAVESWWTARGR